MLKPVLRLVQFGGLAFLLGGCLFDGWGAGIPEVPSIKDDEPYVRALMDANGLKDVPLYDVLKPENPTGREIIYFVALGKRGLKEFRFIPDVAKIKSIRMIDLSLNEISRIPQGVHYKEWRYMVLDANHLCGLSSQDSLALQKSGALWRDQICEVH